MDELHRKKIKHFNVEGHAHLLTFSCFGRQALLDDDMRRRQLSFFIDRAMLRHQCKLIAFVYMPEHLHLLVFPSNDIESVLYAIKKPFSDRVKRLMTRFNDPLLKKLTIQERPGKQVFRFWQEGPGHDRNLLTTEKCVAAAEYIHNNPVRRDCAGRQMNGDGQAGASTIGQTIGITPSRKCTGLWGSPSPKVLW